MLLSSRGSFPTGFLHHVYHQGQGWPPVFPVVHVQPAGHPAAGCRGGPWSHLPVWGSAWPACPGGVPHLPLHQPRRRQVSELQIGWRSMEERGTERHEEMNVGRGLSIIASSVEFKLLVVEIKRTQSELTQFISYYPTLGGVGSWMFGHKLTTAFQPHQMGSEQRIL